MPIVKVCGLTRVADLRLALRLGATYVGAIVEITRSPRSISAAQAARLLRCAGGPGVVVTDSTALEWLAELAEAAGAAAIQLHGAQEPALITALRQQVGPQVEIWGVVGMPADPQAAQRALPSLAETARRYTEAGAAKLVLDTQISGASGGTGVPMSWELARQLIAACRVPVLLAGGITPDNARQALETSGAAGLDVSSGVETRPGVKSPAKLRQLLAVAGRKTEAAEQGIGT